MALKPGNFWTKGMLASLLCLSSLLASASAQDTASKEKSSTDGQAPIVWRYIGANNKTVHSLVPPPADARDVTRSGQTRRCRTN